MASRTKSMRIAAGDTSLVGVSISAKPLEDAEERDPRLPILRGDGTVGVRLSTTAARGLSLIR